MDVTSNAAEVPVEKRGQEVSGIEKDQFGGAVLVGRSRFRMRCPGSGDDVRLKASNTNLLFVVFCRFLSLSSTQAPQPGV